jgi:DNA-binding response OmpR family regulator/two-component sensor histidine kinase
MKSLFFANISHEFRTPLTLIQGPIEKWLPKIKNKEMHNDFEMTKRNSNRLLGLINQLLDLSKIESGAMKLRASNEDIVPLLKGLTQSFESLAKQKNINLVFQTDEPLYLLYFDREKIENIFINLLSNAFKFTPPGGKIEINISTGEAFTGNNLSFPGAVVRNASPQQSNFINITVSNTGPGISTDHIPHIFNRFYQADDSHTREQEGSGIGLALTRELVELHHGKISVGSNVFERQSKCQKLFNEPEINELLTNGNLYTTVFTVLLPLGKDHLKDEEILETSLDYNRATISPQPVSNIEDPGSRIPDPASCKRLSASSLSDRPGSLPHSHLIPKLLVVEDNADVRTYIRGILSSNSKNGQYEIIDAADGKEGLSLALKHHPDLILSDVMMPKMDGFELCKNIKTDQRISHIPVILLTARAAKEDKLEGFETGADAYIPKPFDKDELLVRIKNLIEQRRKLHDKFLTELTVRPEEITVSSMDKSFLTKAIEIVEKNITDEQFDTTKLAAEIGMSRGHLNVKLRALTGFASREFIRALRLKRAAQLIEQRSGTVSEIAYEVGFNSLSHFSKAFRESFGLLPSEYASDREPN